MVDYLAVGSVIIDDIVLPDGTTHMGILGGGGTHGASGARIWADSVALVSTIGRDFPPELYLSLERSFDVQFLSRAESPSPRAWQILESDGRRTEIFRTDFSQFERVYTRVPAGAEYVPQAQRGVYLQSGEPDHLRRWLEMLKSETTPIILWEPWDVFMQPENREAFRDVAGQVDIFSPNLAEVQRLTGLVDPQDIIQALLDDGAQVVALRMAGLGSLIARREERVSTPALKFGEIVDFTGAGNAYGGGFLVGFCESGGDITHAGICGAVSASFALQQFGPFLPAASARDEAVSRLSSLKESRQSAGPGAERATPRRSP